uniref:Nuclease HARBI1 n=1 Tax=Cacopsylla melanoneura TaxID=428564 RepID=A0A8D8QZX1_9HEMI
MTQKTFGILLEELKTIPAYNVLLPEHGGHPPIPIEKKTLIALQYLATQETMHSIGNHFDCTDSTVYNQITSFLLALEILMPKFIKMPTIEEMNTVCNQFELLANFPGVVGAIDGCHLEGLCTAKKIFINTNIGCSGRVHDARVLSESRIYEELEQHGPEAVFGSAERHIIGDSAYPLRPWLMVPYKNRLHLEAPERNYNRALSKTRVVIENTFGLLKGRWRRLQLMNVGSVDRMKKIVKAACVLHNFCLFQDDYLEDYLHTDQTVPQNVYNIRERDANSTAIANAKRDGIRDNL